MTNQTKSNLQISLKTLGIVGLIFFVMAFACRNNARNDAISNARGKTKPPTKSKTRSDSGERCSTEEEFKNYIQTEFHLGTFGEAYGEYKDSEIEFHTFDVSAPTGYTAAEAGHIVKVDTAYPVSADYMTRHYKRDGTRGVNELWEYDWQADFMCYINHRNECVCDRNKYKASDKRVTQLDE